MADPPAVGGRVHGPARGYSWPPFEEGNTAALTHGGYSAAVLQPIADGLAAELVVVAPWCAREVFVASVQAWAWAEAEVQVYRRFMTEHGPLDADYEPRGFLDALHRAETRAAKQRAELGLSPRAWASLLKAMQESGGDEDALAKLREEGRRIIEAREGER
jgi:hypothetical protein